MRLDSVSCLNSVNNLIYWFYLKIIEVQTALYYLLYIDPKYHKTREGRDLLEEFFEKHYFARKKFLVNFLTRNQGLRWNGRFKNIFKKNREIEILDMFKTKKKELSKSFLLVKGI